MTKVRLVDGTIINALSVEVVRGVLQITTTELTVEELAGVFSDKSNTSLITLLTESGEESGYKTGFTSFAGINYNADGEKTVELFQPADDTEQRLAKAESAANLAINTATSATEAANLANEQAATLTEETAMLSETLDTLMFDIIPALTEG